jgi:hypothetical protein
VLSGRLSGQGVVEVFKLIKILASFSEFHIISRERKLLFPRVVFVYVFSMEQSFKINCIILKFYASSIVAKSYLEIILITLKFTYVWYLLQIFVLFYLFE